eukprot:31357-Pelagococcus_subviridis.AAC.1
MPTRASDDRATARVGAIRRHLDGGARDEDDVQRNPTAAAGASLPRRSRSPRRPRRTLGSDDARNRPSRSGATRR